MADWPNLTEIAAQVSIGRGSAEQACRAALERIRERDAMLGAFLEVFPDRALARAREIDAKAARGEPLGALAGAPIAVKDNLCTTFGRTTCGSRMLESYRSPFDATAIARIEAADGVIIGKTNLDEFAMGSSTENSAFHPTRNPWDPQRVSGGSSGGSAAAVAAGMAAAALGSDTGGSVRQPAAFCGVVGLKPTYGRVSRYGLVAYGSSLDQIGVLARTVRDAARVLEVIAGHDPRDSTCVDRPVEPYAALLEDAALETLRPRIGVPGEFFATGLDEEVRSAVQAALDVYRGLGCELVEVSLPHSRYAIAAYYVVATAECSSNLARFDGVHYGRRAASADDMTDLYCTSRAEGFGPEVKRRIMLGTFALSSGYYEAYYAQALKVRRRIQQDFDRAFERVDVLAGPTTPTPAFRLGEMLGDPLQMYLADVYTVPANLAGLPAVSVPCGFTRAGLPVGLQLTGPLFGETRLLQTARLYERHSDWRSRWPAPGG